ncbi:YaaC family protein [Pseudomonas simiae]|nr:YaaC family protein [Pseudomonas simiae]
MQNSTWQKLLFLESHDSVIAWHQQVFSRTLNARRVKEITSAARQAREFFRSSSESNISVKPLLTFYGVASLSRSAALLLNPLGGESGLTPGHGITTVEWSKTLSGDISQGLAALGQLRVKTCKGLFFDILKQTQNTICIHANSSAVDWQISYEIPNLGEELSFDDLILRLPDLKSEHSRSSKSALYASAQELSYNSDSGFTAQITSNNFLELVDSYSSQGYQITNNIAPYNLTCDAQSFQKNPPQFSHSYIHKIFGSIPELHINMPLKSGSRYSQIATTYMASYFLGMLSRYYPTHWTSLFSGEKGDVRWPEIYLAQKYIDLCYPELLLEFLDNHLATNKNKASHTDPTSQEKK